MDHQAELAGHVSMCMYVRVWTTMLHLSGLFNVPLYKHWCCGGLTLSCGDWCYQTSILHCRPRTISHWAAPYFGGNVKIYFISTHRHTQRFYLQRRLQGDWEVWGYPGFWSAPTCKTVKQKVFSAAPGRLSLVAPSRWTSGFDPVFLSNSMEPKLNQNVFSFI